MLIQTPWWNITRSVEGTLPSALTRFGVIPDDPAVDLRLLLVDLANAMRFCPGVT